MNEKEANIILNAAEVFMKYGVKSVNMDDIAKNLGISKKTLYKYVKDKEDLVHKAVHMHCIAEDDAINAICDRGLNAIEESFEMTKFIHGLLKSFHPSILFDLEKYHPKVMHEMMRNRNEQISRCMSRNLQKGMQEGLYREDLNPEVISRAYMAMVNALLKGETSPVEDTPIALIYLEIVRYHIRGIASEKGLELLSNMMKNDKEISDLNSTYIKR